MDKPDARLLSIKSNWDSYFHNNVLAGDASKKLIFADNIADYYTSDEIFMAKKHDISLTFSNILYPIAEKLVQNLSVRTTDIVFNDEKKDVKEKIQRALTISRYSVEKIIEELVFKGYSTAIIIEEEGEIQITTLTSEEEPFFDQFAKSDTFADGNYCGYMCSMSKLSFVEKYGSLTGYSLKKFTETDATTEVKVYYAWLRKKDGIHYCVYTDEKTIISNKSSLKTLPMVLIANVAYRNSEKIKILSLGKFSAECQTRYNKLLTFIHDNVKQSGSYRLLSVAETMNEKNKRDFTEGRDNIEYTPTDPQNAVSSTPLPIKKPPVDKEAMALLEKYKQDLERIWITELDVSTSSKYDSLDVLTEKQRQVENTGVSKLRKVWEQALQTIVAIMHSRITNTKYNISKDTVHVAIGQDAQRFKSVQIQISREILQYIGNMDGGLRLALVRNILKKQDYADNDDLIKMIDAEAARMESQAQQEAQMSPEARKLMIDSQDKALDRQNKLDIAQLNLHTATIQAQNAKDIAIINAKTKLSSTQKQKPDTGDK